MRKFEIIFKMYEFLCGNGVDDDRCMYNIGHIVMGYIVTSRGKLLEA